MSYNIDTFRLKKIDLTLPKDFDMEEFMKEQRCGWEAPIEVASNLTDWEFNWGSEGLEIKGVITPEGFKVTEVRCSGEGSGHDMDILEALLVKFKGSLVASRVWEGGDSIDKITVTKGKIKVEEIDL
jgi:hypothetical protein